MIEWVTQHWGVITGVIAGVVLMMGTLVAVGSEWKEYQDIKQATKAQKEFVERAEKDFSELKAQQARVDERTQIMLDLLKDINSKVK